MKKPKKLSPVEELFNIWLNREYITPNEWSDAIEKDEEQSKVTENTSDGYHTFKELYEFRKAYNVALFNEWASQVKEEKTFCIFYYVANVFYFCLFYTIINSTYFSCQWFNLEWHI